MKRFILNTVAILLIAGLVAAVMWVGTQRSADRCTGIRVDLVNKDSIAFVTSDGILQDINQSKLNPVGKLIDRIDIDGIESHLLESEFIENVECYYDNSNTMVIEARQLVPVMRVFDEGQSYYINRQGKRMSADGEYYVDVPIVEGHFDDKLKPTRLIPIIDYVAKNEVLSTLVSMYVVRDSCNICFVPSISGHIVNLGNGKDLESKFAKLKLFYQKVMPVKGWNTYKEISLKWDYQVVGTLRSKAEIEEVQYNPDEDEMAPDMEMIQLDRENSNNMVVDDVTNIEKAESDANANSHSTDTAKTPEQRVANTFNKTN